jgi:cytochrome b6-f complex subunit 4
VTRPFNPNGAKLPNLQSTIVCQKLTRGTSHNYYGEPAWPNDILYIFPLVIAAVVALSIGLAVGEPTNLGERSSPFATPLEILPEWYFYPTFNLLRVLPDKLIGVCSLIYVPVILIATPIIENTSVYQNPFRRPLAMSIYLATVSYTLWLGIGSLLPIGYSLPLL